MPAYTFDSSVIIAHRVRELPKHSSTLRLNPDGCSPVTHGRAASGKSWDISRRKSLTVSNATKTSSGRGTSLRHSASPLRMRLVQGVALGILLRPENP